MKRKFILIIFAVFGLSYSGKPIEENYLLKVDDNNFGEQIDLSDTSDADVISYYSGVEGKEGDDLKSTLNSIISSDTSAISESKVWDWMKITDRDWSIGDEVDPTTYDFDDDTNYFFRNLYASYNGDESRAINRSMNTSGSVLVDREHCWPKSLGFKSSTSSTFVKPAGTDLHHLMASDHNNNNKHSNYPYGNVDTDKDYTDITDKDSQGNEQATGLLGYSSMYINSSSKVYEPSDEYKGDVARACLYMATRYQDETTTDCTSPFLTLVSDINSIEDDSDGDGGIGYYGELSTLLEWNELDPVDSFEIHRNNLIFNNVQNNRNPYIDHPEWAEIVYDVDYYGDGAVNDAPYVPTETGSGEDTSEEETTTVEEITASTLTEYTVNNILCQSGENDQNLTEEIVEETLVGNQVAVEVLDESHAEFGAMFINDKYKSGKKVGSNKIALHGSDTSIDNYYTNSGDNLVFVLDQNDELLYHFAVSDGASVSQTTIDSWNTPSIPTGYSFDYWYVNDSIIDSSTAIYENTIVKAKVSYDTSNTTYQVVSWGDGAILEDTQGNTGTNLDIQFDQKVTVTSSSSDFSYWMIGDRIVSYDSEYTFSIYADVFIQEITGETVTAVPTINLYHDVYNSNMDDYWVCGFGIPSGNTMVESGVIFGGEIFSEANAKVIAEKYTEDGEFAVHYTGSYSSSCAAYLVYMSGDEVFVIYDNGLGYEQLYYGDLESCTDEKLNELPTFSQGELTVAKNDKLYHDSNFDGIKFGSSNTSAQGMLTITLPDGMTSSKVKVRAKQYGSEEDEFYVNSTADIDGVSDSLDIYGATFTSSNQIIITTPYGERIFIDYIEIFYD